MASPHVDVDELLALAVRLTHEAGDLLVDGLRRERSWVETKSSSTDMVTEMDRAAEALLVEAIHRERPDDGLLGEEGADEGGTSGVRWVIDPIDGTTNYLYRIPAFAVSIAAEVGGASIVGVVRNPVLDETFAAAAGRGATLNGVPLRVTGAATLETALVATGFGYDAERRARQAEIVREVIGSVRDIRRMGSAALDLCAVACGRADAYFERGCQRWDWAAGSLVAREAGAWVGDLTGGGASTAMTIAAAPQLAEPLRRLLAGAGAGDDY